MPRRTETVVARRAGVLSARWRAVAVLLAAMMLCNPLQTGASAMPAGRVAIWQLDAARSEVHFELRALGVIGISGRVVKVQGEVWRDAKGAWVQVRVPLSALRMSSERRRSWALSEEFFDAARHPELVFTAALPAEARVDRLRGELRGTLNLRGIDGPVSIDLAPQDCADDEAVCKVQAYAEVSRRRFGMTTRRMTLSDVVKLDLRLQLKKSPDAAPKPTSRRRRG